MEKAWTSISFHVPEKDQTKRRNLGKKSKHKTLGETPRERVCVDEQGKKD